MNKKKSSINQSNIVEILENAKIVYTDNVEEQFEAIQVTKKGLNIGRILDNKFFSFGFIPVHSIKQIKNGNTRKISKKEM